MTGTFPPGREAPPPIYNGRYELRSQIARGGTAQVYLARDLLLDRPVALKVLFPELSSDSSFVERFRREAQAAANLSHPNIVPVFDWGESESTYFIVMEHVDGEPLSALIRSQAPLQPLRAVAIASDIAKALSYAHRHGVVHRDVKPGNVLITRDGQVKVADFGIARAVGADESVTQTGLVMGTATYFSPEQAQGLGVDGRSDVYSLGVVLYEMVTSRPPFVADTPVAIAYKHVSETPIPPRELEPRLPSQLEAVILRALAKVPANRYATADDFLADLERFSKGVPVLAVDTGGGPPTTALGASSVTAVQQEFGTAAMTGAAGASSALATATGSIGTGQQSKPDMPKRRWIPWVLIGLVLLALLAGLFDFGAHQLGYLGAQPFELMPKVIGEPVATAVQTLEGAGLNAVKSPKPSGTIAKNDVMSTNPTYGQQIRRGSTVTVTYSVGPLPVNVPSEVGQSIDVAKKALTGAGFKPKLVTVAGKLGYPTDKVYAEPAANTLQPPGTTIILEVAAGPASITVPKGIYGLTLAQAEFKLQAAGFKNFATPVYQISSTVPQGDVIKTDPNPGTKTNSDATVTIYVSSGAGVTVPPVTGQLLADAESAIVRAGLTYTVSLSVTSNQSQVGTIVGQNPAGGTLETPGQNVQLTEGVSASDQDTVTVNNPGSQTDPNDSPVSLAVTATDSQSKPLTFSISGAPPGLGLDPATGVISGTPTTKGTYNVTVTATSPSNATGSVTFTWVITPSTPPSTT